jgi:hypothetical protein
VCDQLLQKFSLKIQEFSRRISNLSKNTGIFSQIQGFRLSDKSFSGVLRHQFGRSRERLGNKDKFTGKFIFDR